jgi:hypothetical protein
LNIHNNNSNNNNSNANNNNNNNNNNNINTQTNTIEQKPVVDFFFRTDTTYLAGILRNELIEVAYSDISFLAYPLSRTEIVSFT